MISDYKKYSLIEGPLKAVSLKAMNGANYFSGGKVIVLQLDLGVFHEVFTNDIPGFYENLKEKVPSLYEHFCSPGHPGGFFERVQEGTLLGHVTEHTAIELQTLAGMDVGFGKTRQTNKEGIYNVIFRFLDEHAGLFTAKAALNLINSILLNLPFDVAEIIETLVSIRENRLLGPSTQAIVEEAKRRNIPFLRLDEHNLIQLGTGKEQKKLRATITSDTNHIAIETSDNKYLTSLMLKDAGICVPETIPVDSVSDISNFLEQYKEGIVIKPVYGSSGEGITLKLQDKNEIPDAFAWAKKFSDSALAQEFIPGNVYRLLIINYQFIAATKLVPVELIGDGKKTVQELLTEINSNPKRQVGDKSRLTIVEIDDISTYLLKQQKVDFDSVLAMNQVVQLKLSGSLKNGGTALDITQQVHPMNQYLAERAARIIGLNVAGVDIVSENIRDSILESGGKIIEVNAAPDFRMHLKPTHGMDRDVAKPLVNMLFPDDTKIRVPTFSITGTIGKTTTADLLAHILQRSGFIVGKTTSNGFFVQEKQLKSGNLTFTTDAQTVLHDPTIDCAVLETSLEGILEGGLGYEFADFGIVLNILDSYQLETMDAYLLDLEDVAYAKSVVAEQVYDNGFTILNADDEFVANMRKRLYSTPIFISLSDSNPLVISFLKSGGTAYFISKLHIVKQRGKSQQVLLKQETIPFHNKNPHLLLPALAVCATLSQFGLDSKQIEEGMASFKLI
jgi:cyanophycin synthetase